MRLTKFNIVIIILFTFLSAFVYRIVELITVSYDNLSFTEDDGKTVSNEGPYPDDTLRHILWFLQISDLHISKFNDPSRVKHLQEFCSVTVKAIKPSLVLASGDLTDAKTGDHHGSRQYIEEWKMYEHVISSSGILNSSTVWLDIRGNHDNFNVPSIKSPDNYYRHYSVQGKSHARSYIYNIQKENDTYSFVGVDACLEPGPRRPFNFVGILNEEEMKLLKQYQKETNQSNATVWFGHYPTSSILSPPPGIRNLMRHSHAYLCGHFHTLGGLVPNMYSFQQSGNLELELADWKDSRMYRIAAIDHELFSFIDVPHGRWPVILITNPKHALYIVPTVEPLQRIVHSTHIRILVFSPSPILSVEIKIDDGKWNEGFQSLGPLYILPWNPQLYSSGIHQIHVKVKDTSGREREVSQPFSLDGSQMSFNVLPRLILMSNIITLLQAFFGILLVLSIVPLCLLRMLHKLVLVRKVNKPRFSCKCFQSCVRKLWLLVSVDRLFYPLMFCAIYVPFGPWFIGEIIENHIGACFAWGMYVGNTFLPGGITYGFGAVHILTFQLPLTLFLAHTVDCRYQQMYCEMRVSFGSYLCHHVPFLLLLTWNLWIAYSFLLAYGTLSFALGFLKTWTLLVCLYLWHQVASLPEYCFDSVRMVFPMKRSTTEEQIPLNTNI